MPRPALGVERLESRDTPSVIAVGSQAGDPPLVRVFDETGRLVTLFLAYDLAFRGGVRTAVGDVTGDDLPDIVTVPGAGGGAQVNVYDGRDGRLARAFFAYDPSFRGGASVAIGTIAGRAVIVTGAGAGGGPQVNVFDAQTGALDRSFFAFGPDFAGGVSVAVGDVYGDGRGAVVVAAGPGGGPAVGVFDGPTAAPREAYFAFDPGFRGGVSVAVGDVHGLGRDQVVTGAGPGGGPRVDVHDPLAGLTPDSFFAYDPAFTGGAAVGVIDGPGHERLVTAPGPGGGPDVRVFDLAGGHAAVVNNFFAFAPWFNHGLTLGCGFGTWQPYLVPAEDDTSVPDVWYADPIDSGPVFPDPTYADPWYTYGGTVADDTAWWDSYYDAWYYDTGSYDTGYYDAWYYDAWYYDSGYYDSGYYDAWYYDSGYYDSGYYDAWYYDISSDDYGVEDY